MDSNFGHGTVGGPLVSTEKIARQTANAAIQILSGEKPSGIEMPLLGLEPPIYNWRELQRWNISEARLPADSIVQFREPAPWDHYRSHLTAIGVALLAQMAVITWLLIERRGRRRAERESRQHSLEVMHLNRSAEAGALSASFAHDLSQPLSAMMMNTETADRMIETTLHEVGKLKQVITDIRAANHHATEVIQHLRNLLKRRGEAELEEFDLNDVIAEVVQLLMPEATRRSVNLRVSKRQVQGPLLVRADRIHLLQALLNLVNNGMDEMTDVAPTDRIITIQTTLLDKSRVEVAVSDSGPGIPADKMKNVFDMFYTTKKKGLGLSIARTIVESYGGKIWAENRIEGGAVFRFTLPLLRPA